MSDIIDIKARTAAQRLAGIDVLDEVKSRMVNGDLKGATQTVVIWMTAAGYVGYAHSESADTADVCIMAGAVWDHTNSFIDENQP